MSHFSTIKTKIKEKPFLLKALNCLGYEIKQDQELVVGDPYHALDHPVIQADICIAKDVGFRWNEQEQTYELVTDLETWNQPIPPERLIDKVTQEYARMVLHNTVKDQGFEIVEESKLDNNSIEMTVTRWS